MEFPEVEKDYRKALSNFDDLARVYTKYGSYWEKSNGQWVQPGYVAEDIDTDFFDWHRIALPYRKAVASYYQKNYPELPISAEPDDLMYFFGGSEFTLFSGGEYHDEAHGTKEIHAFWLGPWPVFRNCLIENNPEEAAHLAAVIFQETEGDWRPVGNRDAKDPLVFLKGLQAGKSSRSNVRFTLYRLQQ